MPRLAIIASKITPYRTPVFERLSRMKDVDLQVIFCCEREPNRLWDIPSFEFDHTFLRENYISVRGRYIHHNPDIVPCLKKIAPDIVITPGFNPTHLYAFGYAKAKRWLHVPMTDGTDISEQALSAVHKTVRRMVYARSHAFVSASRGGQRLYESYGIPRDQCFQSCLSIDNDAFLPTEKPEEKYFDFIFSGRIEGVKNPFFALQVAVETSKRLGRKTRILFIGSGSEEDNVKAMAETQSVHVETHFCGFARQEELPSLYRSAKIFLFPTLWDPWGVVVNEACASGLPAIVSPYTGAADELVMDCENGFVCELDVNIWADRACLLLTQQQAWNSFSGRSLSQVKEYTYEKAANGILKASHFSLAARDTEKRRKAS